MSSAEVLQRAIQAARAGRRVEARDLLIELVEVDPRNEMAWIWLTGLVDSPEDRMIACENVLTINPANEKIRTHLAELQRLQSSLHQGKNDADAAGLLSQAKQHAAQNDVDGALKLAVQAVEKQRDCEEAWLLIGRISPSPDQQIAALEKACKLNPSNKKTAAALKNVRYLRAHPVDAAQRLEEQGKFEEALKIYAVQAAVAKDLRDFDRIQRQIARIKRLQEENIRHVTPGSSIARLAFTWPLLYLSLAFFQMGLNPLKHSNFFLWLGLPLVILGGYLISLAEVRCHHMIWQKLFREQGTGSPLARSLTAATGWCLVLVPYLLLLLDSLARLRKFTQF